MSASAICIHYASAAVPPAQTPVARLWQQLQGNRFLICVAAVYGLVISICLVIGLARALYHHDIRAATRATGFAALSVLFALLGICFLYKVIPPSWPVSVLRLSAYIGAAIFALLFLIRLWLRLSPNTTGTWPAFFSVQNLAPVFCALCLCLLGWFCQTEFAIHIIPIALAAASFVASAVSLLLSIVRMRVQGYGD